MDAQPSLLSDLQIMRRLVDEDDERCIFVSPLVDPVAQIGPSSLDVRLGAEIKIPVTAGETHLDVEEAMQLETVFRSVRIGSDKAFVIHPGEFTLASTLEYIRLPYDIAARLEGRSSIARLGISVHATAGFVDPGFRGQLTFEISNVGKLPIRVKPGLRLAQLCFFKVSDCQVPYNLREYSKYPGSFGPGVSKIGQDRDRHGG